MKMDGRLGSWRISAGYDDPKGAKETRGGEVVRRGDFCLVHIQGRGGVSWDK